MALRGIELYSASTGSCTRTMPPASFIALTERVNDFDTAGFGI
jgi:hypothetical protein